MLLGDIESERDSYVEKLSDYEKVGQQLSEMEEREAVLIKNIEDLKTKQTFVLVINNPEIMGLASLSLDVSCVFISLYHGSLPKFFVRFKT